MTSLYHISPLPDNKNLGSSPGEDCKGLFIPDEVCYEPKGSGAANGLVSAFLEPETRLEHMKPDEFYMKRALRLARKGEGRVSPNPMVGAVIVRNSRIIGEGYHQEFGGNHAEINALQAFRPVPAPGSLRGATFYITLEPCTHFGKTPPCVNRIIEARPERVVIGAADPNPLVAGRGIRLLRDRGIKTDVGVLEESCRALNEKFYHFMQTKRPFVTLKFAQTLDGRIAAAGGDSKWISSPPSLKLAHRERSLHDGVLAGIQTILQDDPELTVRLVRGRSPLRIILDSSLRIPLKARVLRDQEKAGTLVITTGRSDRMKRKKLGEMGIEVLTVAGGRKGGIGLNNVLEALGKRGISSLLVEGGSAVLTAFLRENLAQRVLAIIAPKVLGKGIETVGDLGIGSMDRVVRLTFNRVFRRGDDVVIDARFAG